MTMTEMEETMVVTTEGEQDLDLVVELRTDEAAGVVALTMARPGGGPLPRWAPGAHIDIVLADDLVRQYSLCGDALEQDRYRIAVLREEAGRGGSERVHQDLVAGAAVHVKGPRNHFALLDSPRYVFVAGGIGVTPMIPMIAAAESAGAEWHLVYGGRDAGSMAFADDLVRTYGDRVELWPQDQRGLIDLPAALGDPRADTLIYCCGPGPLLDAIEAAAESWPSGALHTERFSPKGVGEPVLTGSFEIELLGSGKTLVVPPDRSILEVVREAGVSVESSCSEGTCGTCETAVLAGRVDHRDSILDEEEQAENDVMFICVSRSVDPMLVLDL